MVHDRIYFTVSADAGMAKLYENEKALASELHTGNLSLNPLPCMTHCRQSTYMWNLLMKASFGMRVSKSAVCTFDVGFLTTASTTTVT